MKVLGIILLVLAALALLPVGVRARYDQDGPLVLAKVWFLRFQVFPRKEKKAKKAQKLPKKEPETSAEDDSSSEKKGGGLDAVRAALPLVKPALQGFKRRLTIQDLELHVTWAADDPADAAVGYGYAQAALGALWAVIDQNFKVKKSALGCSVDFDQATPSVYADATLTLRLGQIVTLAVPLLFKFLSNAMRIKHKKAEKNQERGVNYDGTSH